MNTDHDNLTIPQRIERGRCIAHLYIAAQHLSQVASDDACRLIEEANDPWQNHGFNMEMRKSPYGTRAKGFGEHVLSSREHQSVAFRDMTTPPWLRKLPEAVSDEKIHQSLGHFAFQP